MDSPTTAERTARDALMHWLLSLPETVNQARAAQSMVDHIDALEASQRPASVLAFRQLLHQVANSHTHANATTRQGSDTIRPH